MDAFRGDDAVRRDLVLTHAPTRRAWRLKRWWPERYYRAVISKGNLIRR